jgi:hypothetical protein
MAIGNKIGRVGGKIIDGIERSAPTGLITLLAYRLLNFTAPTDFLIGNIKRNMQQRYDFSRLVNQK